MQELLNIIDRAKSFDVNKLLYAVLQNKDLQEFILDLNRHEQLFLRGINSEGVKLSDIGGDYSPYTLQISSERGRPKRGADHVDLYDTGAFYESFTITIGKQEFYIDANPIKDDTNLFDDWGEDVLGLTEESKEQLISFISEKIIPEIHKYFFGA